MRYRVAPNVEDGFGGSDDATDEGAHGYPDPGEGLRLVQRELFATFMFFSWVNICYFLHVTAKLLVAILFFSQDI